MMEERNRMRSVDDILNPRTKTTDNSSTSGGGGVDASHSIDLTDNNSTEASRRLLRHHQSPRGSDFDTEVIFENVCLPSPLLSYRSTSSSGRRKTLPTASPLTSRRQDNKPQKNTTETSSRGLGVHRPEVGFTNSRGELATAADTCINTRFRGMMNAPSIEHYDVEPAAARGATIISPPRDVINQENSAAALVGIGHRRTHADRWQNVDEEKGAERDVITSAEERDCGSRCDAKTQTTAAANAAAAAGRYKTDAAKDANDANAVWHLSRRSTTTSTESMNSQQQQQQQQQNTARLLLVTDLDAFLDDDPPHTRTTSASIDGHLIPNSSISSISSNVGQQLQSSSSSHPHPHPHHAAAEVIWELSGRKLSNLCHTLITDCGRFTAGGQTESPDDATVAPAIDASAAAAAAAAGVDETRHQHGHKTKLDDNGQIFGEFPTGNSKPSTRSNTSLFGDNNRLTSNGSIDTYPSPDLLNYSPYVHSNEHHRWTSGIDAYTVDLTRQSSEGSFDIRSIPASPLRFAPRGNTPSSSSSVAPFTDAATKGQSVAINTHGAGKVSLETAIDSDDEVFADHNNKGSPDREDRSPEEDAKEFGRRDENSCSSVSSRSAGRRGRTMERGKYDAGLLKDFIKPEFKKFSLPPSSQDLDLDTELAIWELSDFVPDRHQSAPPTDTTMQVAKSDDLLLLRSRQASVSPLRTRISGSRLSPRWIRGAKSVELLTSRNASPGGGKLSRRTLSKEWHVVTLTTREEITTTIRPKSTVVNKISTVDNKYTASAESEFGLNLVDSLASGDQEIQNLRTTLSDGNQFRIGSSNVARSRDIASDVERIHLEERNRHQVADWNDAETDNCLQVESEVKNPSHGQIENVRETEINESYPGIDDQMLLTHATNAKQEDNGHTLDGAGNENRTRTNGEIHAVGSETVSTDQLKSTETLSTLSPSVPCKTGVDGGKGLTVSDELSSLVLSSSGQPEQPSEQQRVLDGGISSSISSSAQNPDEVAFWTIITEALSEMMKEVQLAENNANDTTTTMEDSATKNDIQDTKEQDQNSTAVVSAAESDSLQIVETSSDAENVLISDSFENNCEATDPVGVDIDALVQALLYFANEGGATVESTNMSGTQAAYTPENAQSSSCCKESTHEGFTTIDESLLPSASCWSQDPLNETASTNTTASRFIRTGSDEVILETFCSGGAFPMRVDTRNVMVEEDNNTADSLFLPKLTESTEDSTFAVFDDDFSYQNVDAESFLEIREETDELDSSDHVEEMHSSLSGSQAGDKVTPEGGTSHSDSLTEESSACSDDTVRRRTVSKQDGGAPEVRSMRRESDGSDLFPEKAFLESLFSSLGTIIFLLLAALIFHVFTRIVEHEL